MDYKCCQAVFFGISCRTCSCSAKRPESAKSVVGVPGWPPQTCPRPFSNVAPRRDRCPLLRGNWPPQTCPRPFSNVAPRRDRCPLTRGNWPPQTYPRPFWLLVTRRDEFPLTRGNSNPSGSSSFRAAGKVDMVSSSYGP